MCVTISATIVSYETWSDKCLTKQAISILQMGTLVANTYCKKTVKKVGHILNLGYEFYEDI
jgi:hypothetical protein